LPEDELAGSEEAPHDFVQASRYLREFCMPNSERDEHFIVRTSDLDAIGRKNLHNGKIFA
jgi:hypothetical protein